MELEKLKDPYVDMLFDAILLLENREECYRFFEDICTIGEVQSMAQRLQVAKMLKKVGHIRKLPRQQVQAATISRVKRFCTMAPTDTIRY